MQGRSAQTDATKFINGGQCTIATRLSTSGSPAYEFKTGNNLGNVIARQVQLTGGDPAKDKVLVSDKEGNARWAKATVSNGSVVFDTNISPVPAGQCSPVAPKDTYHWEVGNFICPTNQILGPMWRDADYPNGTIGQSCKSLLVVIMEHCKKND